ncbi:hypothetical protein D3C72_1988250 [compost metagenome]
MERMPSASCSISGWYCASPVSSVYFTSASRHTALPPSLISLPMSTRNAACVPSASVARRISRWLRKASARSMAAFCVSLRVSSQPSSMA